MQVLAHSPDNACSLQSRQLATGAWTDEAAFWRAQLAYAPLLLELPTDRPRPLLLSTKAGAAVVMSPAGLAPRLHALATSSNATLFMVVMAAWKVRRMHHPLHPVAVGQRGMRNGGHRWLGWWHALLCRFALARWIWRGVDELWVTERRSRSAELVDMQLPGHLPKLVAHSGWAVGAHWTGPPGRTAHVCLPVCGAAAWQAAGGAHE